MMLLVRFNEQLMSVMLSKNERAISYDDLDLDYFTDKTLDTEVPEPP